MFDSADDLFGEEPTLIQEAILLSDSYIPPRLIARDGEIRRVVKVLNPGLWRGIPDHCFIYGTTGTGKTVVTRYVLQRFTEKAKANDLKVVTVFVGCKDHSPTQIVTLIREAVPLEVKLPPRGLSISEYVHDICAALKETHCSLVIVFDEIDALGNTNILYQLTRAKANGELANDQFITIIGITNDTTWVEDLEPRVISSMHPKPILFKSYSAPQLTEILTGRKPAFKEGVVDDAVIPLCAALGAKEHGDARKAIQLLREAGETAQAELSPRVTEEHVLLAVETIEVNTIEQLVMSLPGQSKRVLEAIAVVLTATGGEPVQTGEVYKRYQAITQSYGGVPAHRTRIAQIVTELDMLGIINAPERRKGRGRTRKIRLTSPPETILEILERSYDEGLFAPPADYVTEGVPPS